MKMNKYLRVIIITILLSGIVSCGNSKKKDSVFSNPVKAYNRSKKSIAIDQITTISRAVDSYYIDNGNFPETLNDLIPMYLRTENEITDPWGSPFEIRTDDNENFYIISPGRDLSFETNDDVKRSL